MCLYSSLPHIFFIFINNKNHHSTSPLITLIFWSIRLKYSCAFINPMYEAYICFSWMLLSASKTSSLYDINFYIQIASSNFRFSSTWIPTASFIYFRDYLFSLAIAWAKSSSNLFSFSLYLFYFSPITDSTCFIFSINFYFSSLIVSFSFSWYIWISSRTGMNSWSPRLTPIDDEDLDAGSTLWEWYLLWLWFWSVKHFEHFSALQLRQ